MSEKKSFVSDVVLGKLDPIETQKLIKSLQKLGYLPGRANERGFIDRGVRDLMQSFLPGRSTAECPVVTYQGKNCSRAFRYVDQTGQDSNVKDCTDYCLLHASKWLPNIILNHPKFAILKEIDKKEASSEIAFAFVTIELTEKSKGKIVSLVWAKDNDKWYIRQHGSVAEKDQDINRVVRFLSQRQRERKSNRMRSTRPITRETLFVGFSEITELDAIAVFQDIDARNEARNELHHVNTSAICYRPFGYSITTGAAGAHRVRVARFGPKSERWFQALSHWSVRSVNTREDSKYYILKLEEP